MRLVACGVLCLCVAGCGAEDADVSGAGGSGGASCTGVYCDDALWLCKPGKPDDFCADEQTATEFAADGTTSTRTLPKASDPPIDCFYVYPTVALSGEAGNVEDFSNIEDIKVPVRAQAAPFSEACAVYAPLYHQIRFATYTAGDPTLYLEKAYEDVALAFHVYLEHYSGGRDFVIMGHSQGSHMTRRLLQREIEPNEKLRQRLVVAMPIGPVNDITVPTLGMVGGTFSKLALCSSAEERGCVVSYDSHPAGGTSAAGASAGAGLDPACVNPAAPATPGPARLAAAVFPTSKHQGQFSTGPDDGLDTTFKVYPSLFTAECARNTAGFSYLAIGFAPGANDVRTNPVPFSGGIVDVLGLHVSDYSFPLAELIGLVRAKSLQ